MKAKIFLIAILLVTGASVKAQVADKVTALSEAMKNIRSEKDDFTHITKYYSERTPNDQNDFYDRFFLYISAPENSEEPRLLLKVSHSSTIHPIKGYLSIKSIVLLSDAKILTLPINLGTISGNGTQHSSFTMGFGKRPIYFDFVKGMTSAQTTKARIITENNKLVDFEISSKERKAMSEVLALWELMKK